RKELPNQSPAASGLWHGGCIGLDTHVATKVSLLNAKECAMLVLTRKQQERIHIGENITITVVRLQGNTVRIGIEAPREVRVLRGEIAVKEAQSDSPFAVISAEEGRPQAGDTDGNVAAGLPHGGPLSGSAAVRRRPCLVISSAAVPAHAV
ncbi:MAG: carbon storage regulator, partial [Deltaproteobacteria bacterium]